MERFRVLTSAGATYGDFSDYELALGQAEHLTARNRRHKQEATVQVNDAEPASDGWVDVVTLLPGGALKEPVLVPRGRRGRLSALAV
jgi:hypothetical protein